MALPVIAIVGRPNVGKSTLFNCLTQRRDALVADKPGVTRDRQYGIITYEQHHWLLIDTGGLFDTSQPAMAAQVDQQVLLALEEADKVLLCVDAQLGITPADEQIVQFLRKRQLSPTVVVNKVDREQAECAVAEFHRWGFAELFAVSALSSRGVDLLCQHLADLLPNDADQPESDDLGPRVSVLGRPNVGKSTLINRMVGSERCVVMDQPGTTRDAVTIDCQKGSWRYQLVDTAGIRKKSKISEAIEHFSVMQSLDAAKRSDIVLMVLHAGDGITEQDLRLLGLIVELGKALVLIFNQWDKVDDQAGKYFVQEVERRMPFVQYAPRLRISARTGYGTAGIIPLLKRIERGLRQTISTAEATRLLELAVKAHPPPMVRGRRIKLRYAHVASRHPITLLIHGKQVGDLPDAYSRYLSGFYRDALKLLGVPVKIKLSTNANPYVQ